MYSYDKYLFVYVLRLDYATKMAMFFTYYEKYYLRICYNTQNNFEGNSL